MVYVVKKGKQLGRKIDFPTLNLYPAELSENFVYGVYACEVCFLNTHQKYKGILHYGAKKTLSEKKIALEVHLFDFDQKVYGAKLSLKVGQKIRDVQKFKDLNTLKKQIKKDIAKIQDLNLSENNRFF